MDFHGFVSMLLPFFLFSLPFPNTSRKLERAGVHDHGLSSTLKRLVGRPSAKENQFHLLVSYV
jgi:hypothetical protein